jgi:hypothetical protein
VVRLGRRAGARGDSRPAAELQRTSRGEIAAILIVLQANVKALVFLAQEALMSARQPREADCGEPREQLAVLRGSAPRCRQIRHHVKHCECCRVFAREVQRQRAALAVLLPVVPSLTLKRRTLSALTATGSGASTDHAIRPPTTAAATRSADATR